MKEDVLFGLCPATFSMRFIVSVSMWSISSLTDCLADFSRLHRFSATGQDGRAAAAKAPIGGLGLEGGATAGRNKIKRVVVVVFVVVAGRQLVDAYINSHGRSE